MVFTIGIRLNLLDIPLERDEGLFGYIGQRVVQGEVPYRDVIDHKPPVVYWLYAASQLVVPATPRGVHLFLLAYVLATAGVVFLIARRLWGVAAAAWAGLAFAVLSADPGVQGFSATTEMFLLLPASLSLLCAVEGVRPAKAAWVVASGAFASIACWTKPTAFPIVACAGLYVVFVSIRADGTRIAKWRIALRAGLSWAGGGVLVSIGIVGFFFVHHAVAPMLYWVFDYNVLYSAATPLAVVMTSLAVQAWVLVSSNPVLVLLAVAAGPVFVVRRRPGGWLLVGLVLASVAAVMPGHAYRHYFAQCVPALALGAGAAAGWLSDRARSGSSRVATVVALMLAIGGIPLLAHGDYYFDQTPTEISRSYFGSNPFPESILLGEYIRDRTTPDDSVYIFGSEAQILFYAERRCASSLAMVYPLTREDFPRYRELQTRVWSEIEAARPAYVLIVDIPTSLGWDGRADLWLRERLLEYVKEEYQLEAVVDNSGRGAGRLVEVTDPSKLEHQLRGGRPRIFVYHQTS